MDVIDQADIKDNDLTPITQVDKTSRITKDLPEDMRVSKILRQVDQSGESNLLESIPNFDQNMADMNLLTDDNLLASQDLLIDGNPLDEIGLLDDEFDTDQMLEKELKRRN